MTHLELVNLTKRFGDVVSVDAIDIAVERGEFVCLLGPSGCGKTTTLRMIAGFLEPDGGEIRVGGKTISAPGSVIPPERRNMGMIFQSYAVWPHMTVMQNVAYGLKMQKVKADERTTRSDAMLKAARLADYAQRYPSELSGGQQQRVALARALARVPTSFSSTSRCRTSMRIFAATCASRSAVSTKSSATRPSTSRTTRSRR